MLKEIVLAGLISSASAHIILRAPVPFPFSNTKLQQDPLLADGANFPCKNPLYDAPTPSNEYAQGSNQTLKFIGTAVHAGGSCQVSFTTDLKPSKNTVWKVIKSIEGGCPAKGLDNNILPENAQLPTPYEYSFTVPKDLVPGKYTLAWSWFNKIGNREMYMNCAPITVTGSGGSKDALGALPDMFVANVGNGCGTLPGTDLKFPNPGKDLDQFGQQTPAALKGPTGNCAAASGPQPTGGSKPSGDSQPSGAPQPTGAPQPSGAADSAGTIPGGVFITKSQAQASQPVATSQAQASQPAATSQVPVPSAADGPAPGPSTDCSSPPPAATGTGGGNAGSFAAGTACSTEGMWNCIGGTSFQRCGAGQWSAPQNVAAGTKCSPGQSPELKVDASQGNKRSIRRSTRFSA